ncbi:MAG: hypothetical protein KKE83_11860 [Proteobacteria bacterium]|nr:hypothetical protein [Pseudomonadota bacterium]MBU1547014.1 hypothetical protein [Pseudomonadota bacterium]MBU2620367.1 hypothetical protein [Pseudomonadota bacterium]
MKKPMKRVHYNFSLHPEKHVLPACMINIIGSDKKRPDYQGTTNQAAVTCARCLKIIGVQGEIKKIILTVAVVLFAAVPAVMAADCESIRPDLMTRAQQMAQNARDREIKDFSEASAATLEGGSPGQSGKPGAANASSSNCLEKYKDVKVGSMIGVPSVSDLAKQALDRVSKAACTGIDSIYNQAGASMSQSVVLPGNIGGAQVGLPGASQLGNPYQSPNTVSTPGADVTVKKSNGGIISNTINGIPNYIKGIFQ